MARPFADARQRKVPPSRSSASELPKPAHRQLDRQIEHEPRVRRVKRVAGRRPRQLVGGDHQQSGPPVQRLRHRADSRRVGSRRRQRQRQRRRHRQHDLRPGQQLKHLEHLPGHPAQQRDHAPASRSTGARTSRATRSSAPAATAESTSGCVSARARPSGGRATAAPDRCQCRDDVHPEQNDANPNPAAEPPPPAPVAKPK